MAVVEIDVYLSKEQEPFHSFRYEGPSFDRLWVEGQGGLVRHLGGFRVISTTLHVRRGSEEQHMRMIVERD